MDGVIESDHDNLLQTLKDMFIDKLQLDAEMVESILFVCIHRLMPTNQGAQKPRTIIVKFHWFGNRTKVGEVRKNFKVHTFC